MNFLALASFALAVVVFLTAVLTTGNPKALVDMHGMLIVLGGSAACVSISFQLDRLLVMIRVFWHRTIKGHKPNYVKIITSLMKIAESYRNNAPDIQTVIDSSNDLFIKESMGILLDEIVDKERMFTILTNRVDTIYERYNSDAARFRASGKYPPAMGLMGAVLGMIALLGTLGKPGAEKTVGPAMSVALVATFYGIALANLIIIPIGENLTEAAKEIRTKNRIIIEGVRLISERTNPIVLAEELNSYLLPGERVDWKNI